jgi:hypothetical protein
MPLVYGELRRAARRWMGRQPPDHSLHATGLVHEVYLRLVDFHEVTWRDRAHFLAVCAQLMRRILVDYARARGCRKRGESLASSPVDGLSLEAWRRTAALQRGLARVQKVEVGC